MNIEHITQTITKTEITLARMQAESLSQFEHEVSGKFIMIAVPSI